MNLFEYMKEQNGEKTAPLASRMRPQTLEDIVGQDHIIGTDKLLYRAIRADRLSSVIFYGPPGTGKTTIAKVIANTTKSEFRQINATSAGKKDMEDVVEEARQRFALEGRRTILFIDEIHRFNKGQQDYLLPFVEDGTIILIGATTENPYFEVNGALLSRSIILELKPLTREDIRELLKRAVSDEKHGLGMFRLDVSEEAFEHISDMANGDARKALNALELGALTTNPGTDGVIRIDLAVAEECIRRRALKYDKSGDNHYDTVSAFIKSIRGSDPDAALYYLARMIEAGEDLKFITRRMMISACEDVGNADPQALQMAVAGALAAERIGMPESVHILGEVATYLACAPKSNSASSAAFEALRVVREQGNPKIPVPLQDAHYGGASRLGHGEGYLYSHDFPNHYSGQRYLPEELEGTVFYKPGELGYEKTMKEWMEWLKRGAKGDRNET